jgi:hypothetical protein
MCLPDVFKGGRCFTLSPAPLLTLVATLLFCCVPAQSRAATNLVTTLADDGPGSLRQTIAGAAPGDTIMFATPAGSLSLTQELVLAKDLNLVGPGWNNLSISGNKVTRLFRIAANATALISGLTLCNGQSSNGINGLSGELSPTPGTAGEPGGAIWTAGTLALNDCVLRDNSSGRGGNGAASQYSASRGAEGGAGGAIYSTGLLTLSNCLIFQNVSGAGGVSGQASTYSVTGGQGGAGGAICSMGPLSVFGTVIRSNQTGAGASTVLEAAGAMGGAGGGVWCAGSLIATDSSFLQNATGNGGNGGADNSVAGPGAAGGDGGGVWCGGALAMTNCSLSRNSCGAGGRGGGAGNLGFATCGWGGGGGSGCALYCTNMTCLFGCTVDNNAGGGGGDGGSGDNGGGGGAGSSGAGIYSVSEIVLIACTVSSNHCGTGGNGGSGHPGPFGGGGYAGSGGGGGFGAGICALRELWMTNCTITDNVCGNGGETGYGSLSTGFGGQGGSGGGVCLDWGTNAACSASCSIIGNRAGSPGSGPAGVGTPGTGGGILNNPNRLQSVLNTIIADNSGTVPDASGDFVSLGHNLVGVTNGSTGFTSPGDRVGSLLSPLACRVGPLADNGGPTWTMALLPDSPALEAGTAVGIPGTDQRGVLRPQGVFVDIGAFEHEYNIPAIFSAAFQGQDFRIQCFGLPSRGYLILGSTNLLSWSEVKAVTSSDTGAFDYTDPGALNRETFFYRLQAAPVAAPEPR